MTVLKANHHKGTMANYLDLLPNDCIEIILDKRISNIETELNNLDKAIRKKLDNVYKKEKEKEKKNNTRHFNFDAFRAAVNRRVYITGVR